MDRITRLLASADRSNRILELGAGYSPVAPKSAGWKTHVVDHASRDELRVKYATAGVDTESIEDVDTIWRGEPFHEVVPGSLVGDLDLIIASHVLEHIPDLIGFFQSASRLVRPGGKLSVALPDRRYCFDCFRPWTTTGCLLEAHRRRMTRHGLKTAYDHVAYFAAADGAIAWGPRPIAEPKLLNAFEAAAGTVMEFTDHPDGAYQDYHAWQFTPAGFELVMLELAALGLTDWQVAELHGPENFEFFAILRRDGVRRSTPAGLQSHRQKLLISQLIEARQQVDFILGASNPAGTGEPDFGPTVIAKLADQDRRLQEISETLAWLRAILSPIRRGWRILRRIDADAT